MAMNHQELAERQGAILSEMERLATQTIEAAGTIIQGWYLEAAKKTIAAQLDVSETNRDQKLPALKADVKRIQADSARLSTNLLQGEGIWPHRNATNAGDSASIMNKSKNALTRALTEMEMPLRDVLGRNGYSIQKVPGAQWEKVQTLRARYQELWNERRTVEEQIAQVNLDSRAKQVLDIFDKS